MFHSRRLKTGDSWTGFDGRMMMATVTASENPLSECFNAMNQADTNNDRILNRREYFTFVNNFLNNKFEGLTFKELPQPWKRHLFQWRDEDTNQFNIFGSREGENADITQEAFLNTVCTETEAATSSPTISPTASPAPSKKPTNTPSYQPTDSPTAALTDEPSYAPTELPTASPTESIEPTSVPSDEPSPAPSDEPSQTSMPSNEPTLEPTTASPTVQPSARPSQSSMPSDVPSALLASLTLGPTLDPTEMPSDPPSPKPSTTSPTEPPTSGPTQRPTEMPSDITTPMPTSRPPTSRPTTGPAETASPSSEPPTSSSAASSISARLSYCPGDFSNNTRSDDGMLMVSNGLSCKRIATSGDFVQYANGNSSVERFHDQPDGAAVFHKKDGSGGWYYVSNSEIHQMGSCWNCGGVGAIEFDSNGGVVGYKRIASDLRKNCGGGKTPWNSWITCEETATVDYLGQVHQVDPTGKRPHELTAFGKLGLYESFAYDETTSIPTFYVTRDAPYGVLTRFTPNATGMGCYNQTDDYDRWCTLQNGDVDYLVLSGPNETGTFTWTTNETAARHSANTHFPGAEGIDASDGKVFFTSKTLKRLIILDLAAQTYVYSSTANGAFAGEPGTTGKRMFSLWNAVF